MTFSLKRSVTNVFVTRILIISLTSVFTASLLLVGSFIYAHAQEAKSAGNSATGGNSIVTNKPNTIFSPTFNVTVILNPDPTGKPANKTNPHPLAPKPASTSPPGPLSSQPPAPSTEPLSSQSQPTARITDVESQCCVTVNFPNGVVEGGMMIHLFFNVQNMRHGTAEAYFYDSRGPLASGGPDLTGASYSAPDDQATTFEPFSPGYQNTVYADFKLFIPYYELRFAQGQAWFQVVIWDYSTGYTQPVANSFPVYFPPPPPP